MYFSVVASGVVDTTDISFLDQVPEFLAISYRDMVTVGSGIGMFIAGTTSWYSLLKTRNDVLLQKLKIKEEEKKKEKEKEKET